MARETQHALLLLFGGALVRIAADGTYLRYVRPSHRWALVAVGVVMAVLAAVALWRDRRGTVVDDRAPGPAPWLLVLPVLAVALVAPPPLGADAVSRAGARNAVVGGDVLGPLPPGPAPALPLAELVARAAGGQLDGREVAATGFVVRRGTAVDLARMRIACCAADARATRVHLAGDLGAPARDTWLRVRGTVAPGSATAATGFVPTLIVSAAETVAAPSDPYEY